jgi:hypothetical protein
MKKLSMLLVMVLVLSSLGFSVNVTKVTGKTVIARDSLISEGTAYIFDTELSGKFSFEQGGNLVTSATTDATITPVNSFHRVDTHQSVAISTVNLVTTANFEIGSVITLMTVNSTRDIVLIETGNLALGATTRTLANNEQLIKLIKIASDKWAEIGFFAN